MVCFYPRLYKWVSYYPKDSIAACINVCSASTYSKQFFSDEYSVIAIILSLNSSYISNS